MSKIRTEGGITVQLLDANEDNRCRELKEKHPHIAFLGATLTLVKEKKKAERKSTSKLMQAYKRKTGGK